MPTPPIKWNHDLILELAPRCKSKRELGYEYAKAVGIKIAPNTLTAYLHRNAELREQVDAAMQVYAGEQPRPWTPPDEVSREELLEQEVKELRSHFSKTRKADVHVERLTQADRRGPGDCEPRPPGSSRRGP